WPELERRSHYVFSDVGCDDGGNDAAITGTNPVKLSPLFSGPASTFSRAADRIRSCRLLFALDFLRASGVHPGHGAGDNRNETGGSRATRSCRDGGDATAYWIVSAHFVESWPA